jgi:D-aminoacyl-tRNA deacylase
LRILVTSQKDIASLTIRDILVHEHSLVETGEIFEGSPVFSLGESVKMITTERDMIYCDHLEQSHRPDAFVFCSRHRSESGQPALLVHSTGNLGNAADFGGNPRQLSVSAPSLVSAALRRLYDERNARGLVEFDVSLEVTHHGPTTLETPMVFVELGSDEEHWRHQEGARAVAAAALEACSVPMECEAGIGFGGTHYASKFNKLVLERGQYIGHVAPKYVLDEITPDIIQQMITRSAAKTTRAIIDWKGTNAENKARLFPLLEEAGLDIVRAKDV